MTWERICATITDHLRTLGSGLLRHPDYERLLDHIASRPDRFVVESATDFAAPPRSASADKARIFLRHDVDVDMPGAETMGRIEGALGMRASYFLLHSHSFYYGRFDADGVFWRYPALIDVVRRIQAAGHDIGLHIDPLGICGYNRVDGIQAMLAEIAYLRGKGIDVFSVCGHNSNANYNALNKDVFAGENVSGQRYIEMEDGVRVPLGTVDAAANGIRVVADFNRTVGVKPIERSVSSHYGFVIDRMPVFEFDYDVGLSLVLGHSWELNGRREFLGNARSIPDDAIASALDAVPPGYKVVLNIHPMYYGRRD
jgi:hypothetical protein